MSSPPPPEGYEAAGVSEQVARIHHAWVLMEDRYQLLLDGDATSKDFEPVVVHLEEVAELRGDLMVREARIRSGGDGPPSSEVLAELTALIRKGRAAGVHVVLSSQLPGVRLLNAEVRNNFTVRVLLCRSEEGTS